MGKWQLKMKRSHLIRLVGSDVFSVPPSLGLKTPQQNYTTLGVLARGLHPLSYRFAQSTIGETMVFTDWVERVLKLNTELPRRNCWSELTRNLEKEMYE